MAVAIRWSIAAVGALLIVAGFLWTFAPGTEWFGAESFGFFGSPVLPTDNWNYYAAGLTWLGLVLLTQWFFLRPRGGWALREESKGRSMRFATFGAGFCAMLITFGLGAALLEIPDLWADNVFLDEIYHPGVYGWMVGLWAIWSMAFYRYFRSRSKILRALIAGTVLELLVAAPVHAACYKRDDCYCSRGSYTALVFGGTALFWVFGPGIFILYLRERKRRGRLLRVCPACGHDLSGSAATICPECSEDLGE
ncbi:MAG: hypothetical protein ACYTHK_11985 [Planctomycetota bacterium]|jgi:hypothetical protein